MFNSWSFRKKLIVLWLTVQIFFTGITAIFAINSASTYIEKDIIYQAEQVQIVLISALVTPLIQRDYASIIAILKELVRSDNIEKISIRDNNNNLVAQETDLLNKKITPYPFEFTILSDGINLGKASVDISRAKLVDAQASIILYTGLISAITLFIFYLCALLMSSYITRPISDLAQIAERISQGDFKVPEFSTRYDEIGSLQHAFKSMSIEIAKEIRDLELMNLTLEKRVQDRTESLQSAKDALAEKVDDLKLLGAVVDNAYFGISIVDLNTPKNSLIYVNPAFTRVTGYTQEEVIGTTCRIFQDGISDSETMDKINWALKNKTACTVEFLDQRRNGDEFWNRLSIFPVMLEENMPRYYVLFQNDISELKKANIDREIRLQEIQENQRLKSLAVLVAGLAHEINNPIGIALTATTHISQSAAAIRKNISNLEVTDIADFFEDEEIAFQLIFENLKRAGDLVGGFKDISSDKVLNTQKEINLQTYIESIGQTFIPVLKNTRCSLKLHIDPIISMQVNTGSLSQLITNLVLNATIHAFDDGQKDCQIQILGTQDAEYIFLKIRDNGHGIPPHVLPNLFTPFYTTNRNNGGTGLGLYMSRQIATDVLKGSLNVLNLPNTGCEFTLKIPRY